MKNFKLIFLAAVAGIFIACEAISPEEKALIGKWSEQYHVDIYVASINFDEDGFAHYQKKLIQHGLQLLMKQEALQHCGILSRIINYISLEKIVYGVKRHLITRMYLSHLLPIIPYKEMCSLLILLHTMAG